MHFAPPSSKSEDFIEVISVFMLTLRDKNVFFSLDFCKLKTEFSRSITISVINFYLLML